MRVKNSKYIHFLNLITATKQHENQIILTTHSCKCNGYLCVNVIHTYHYILESGSSSKKSSKKTSVTTPATILEIAEVSNGNF